jgi:hypothetical protein
MPIQLTEKSMLWCIHRAIAAIILCSLPPVDQEDLLIKELVRELEFVEHDTHLIKVIKSNLNSLREKYSYLSEIIPEYKL